MGARGVSEGCGMTRRVAGSEASEQVAPFSRGLRPGQLPAAHGHWYVNHDTTYYSWVHVISLPIAIYIMYGVSACQLRLLGKAAHYLRLRLPEGSTLCLLVRPVRNVDRKHLLRVTY